MNRSDALQLGLVLASLILSLLGFVFPDSTGWATVPATGACVIAALKEKEKERSASPRRSRYVGGWFCSQCGADNADEDSACADKERCDECGAPRHPFGTSKT